MRFDRRAADHDRMHPPGSTDTLPGPGKRTLTAEAVAPAQAASKTPTSAARDANANTPPWPPRPGPAGARAMPHAIAAPVHTTGAQPPTQVALGDRFGRPSVQRREADPQRAPVDPQVHRHLHSRLHRKRRRCPIPDVSPKHAGSLRRACRTVGWVHASGSSPCGQGRGRCVLRTGEPTAAMLARAPPRRRAGRGTRIDLLVDRARDHVAVHDLLNEQLPGI
jgi:hypothetical protein